MRRKGQSLEFKDFVPYAFGDDIRHVDWRTSARYGFADDKLIRQFVAEEHLTLVISIDTRRTMDLPEAMSKHIIAMWLAEAVSRIVLGSGDRIVLHRLFGSPEGSLTEIKGGGNSGMIRSGLNAISNTGNTGKTGRDINLNILQPKLPPAAVWLIVTDFYFDKTRIEPLANSIAAAQDGLRWIILAELDSWPHEKLLLGEGARHIHGPGLDLQDPRFHIDHDSIRKIEAEIKKHKQDFINNVHHGAFDQIHWRWPAVERPDPVDFFHKAFFKDMILRRLFMREG